MRLYGLHAVRPALENPARKVSRIWLTTDAAETLAPALTGPQADRLPPVQITARREIDRLVPEGAVHQGCVIEASLPDAPDLDDLFRDPASLTRPLVMLDQVTDPHNVGAIMRSAAAFGAAALIVQDRHSPEITGTLARNACGAVEVLPLVRVTNLARALEAIGAAGWWRVGLDERGTDTLARATAGLAQPVCLVMGAEGDGMRRLTRENCDRLVKLPTMPPILSLNVSNAAAISLYELSRSPAD